MIRICPECSGEVLGHFNRKYCSEVCARKHVYIDKREAILRKMQEDRPANYILPKWRIMRLVSSAKRRARMKDVPFNISSEYLTNMWIEQKGKCCISGRDFDLLPSPERVNKNAPSLDRIIPELGYVVGNLRLVTWQINASISEYGFENFMAICQDVINFNKDNRVN